jgi:ATP-dependent exoDNAse (exonuclease V) beta subunit
MSSSTIKASPPDQPQRRRALDAGRSILVQAPAGSGKTDLLTRRFLRLLAEVDDPSQIVAITFTRAAAAGMRNRILSELEKAAANDSPDSDEFSMLSLARRALDRSYAGGWQLLDLPAQLRISTIDSFCRDLAIQQPLLSGFGSDLQITEQPRDLYRRAARNTLQKISLGNSPLSAAIESLLLWRDNNWHEMEALLVDMLAQRDRWMHDFVLSREPDWVALRERLERPFVRAIADALAHIGRLLDQVPHARQEALLLARFACSQGAAALHQDLAELPEFPNGPFSDNDALEAARRAHICLAKLLLTDDGDFRKKVDKRNGFPTEHKSEKARHAALISDLRNISGFDDSLAAIASLPPAHYTDENWAIVRACFMLLRGAAAELQIVFAETGVVDFIEVAQIAQRVLAGDDGLPTDTAIDLADGIRHLLVDEFQDTSRRQHRLLAKLAAAWPDPHGRTIFVVGDPMQSIYSFRDADAELFHRVQKFGLEISDGDQLLFDFVSLTANFRTTPALVRELNQSFTQIFASDDGSGVTFSSAEPFRDAVPPSTPRLALHLEFMPQSERSASFNPDSAVRRLESQRQRQAAIEAQTADLIAVIRTHLDRMAQAEARGEKYRVAILARTRKSLEQLAAALRQSQIPFLAVELEKLKDRPEILDALALARALLNPLDRVAWLGVLRAPWCALSLADLHTLSIDDPDSTRRSIPDLLNERVHFLNMRSRNAVQRVLDATNSVPRLRNQLPTATVGTLLEQVWLSLGGASCVDATARANLHLLWTALDGLPSGEPDMLHSALDSALEKLTALPNPEASTDCGVQLMTIHKSKGLEFEVVIVPDMQAHGSKTRGDLLAWLERGLAESGDSGEITEFLVAPIQSKGADRGQAKAWIDRIRCERDLQEARRILYVAATRAREELHLFARPEYKDDSGALALVNPSNCLLSTAWPAFAAEIQSRFDEWNSARAAAPESEVVEDIAAGEGNLLIMPSPARPAILRRLPADFHPPQTDSFSDVFSSEVPIGLDGPQLYARHEGGALSRALGTAVHSLLEQIALLRTTRDWPSTRAALTQMQPRILAPMRAGGISLPEANSLAASALDLALKATHDPHGQWILSPHEDATSEAAWAGIVDGVLRTVRIDRIFRAGLEPLSTGDDAWWIVDYKTAHADDLDPSVALPSLRRIFAPQIEAYAAVLRNRHGRGKALRAALYYPRMSSFDWWEIPN